jgi:hypothetical protein
MTSSKNAADTLGGACVISISGRPASTMDLNREYDMSYSTWYDAHGNVVLQVSAPPDIKKAKQRGRGRSFAVPPAQEGAHRDAKQARSRLPHSG